MATDGAEGRNVALVHVNRLSCEFKRRDDVGISPPITRNGGLVVFPLIALEVFVISFVPDPFLPGRDGPLNATTTSWLTRGRPHQFMLMWANSRCSL